MDVTTLLTLASVSLTATAVYYHIKVFSFWKSHGIDGPTPWPFFGTNIYFLFNNKVDIEADWHKKYGHTYGEYDGCWPVLRTTDNDIIKQVWIKGFSSFTKRFNGMFVYGSVQRNWLFWSSGDHWANQRALVSPMFTAVRMKSMLTMMKSCAETLIDEITKKFDTSFNINGAAKENNVTQERLVISKDELMAYNLDVVAQSLFGIKLNTYMDKSSKFFKKAFAFSVFSISRFMAYLIMPAFVGRFLKFDLIHYSKFEYFDKLTESLLKERRHSKTKIYPNDFIQMLIEAKIPDEYQKIYTTEDETDSHYIGNVSQDKLEELQKEQTKRAKYFRSFHDLEIKGHTTFLFLAGFETTSSAISFCLYEFAHHQNEQEEVYREIETTLDGKSFYKIELNQITELKKLDAFISEALRLYSPTINNNRMVTDKNGHTILVNGRSIKLPYKCGVAHNPFLVQRHPDYWQDPMKFDMTRFYRENRDLIKPCTYVPFGVGPRHCVGMRFALLNIRVSLTNLIYNYKFYPGPNSEQYPPNYKQHAFFLQLTSSDIRVESRRRRRISQK